MQVVAVKYRNIRIGGGAAFVGLTFVAGLALGLNIHPPDQHELEMGTRLGHEAGYQQGFLEGRQKGYAKGHAQGVKDGESLGRAAAAKRLKGRIDELTKGVIKADDLMQKTTQTYFNDMRTAVTNARDAAYDEGLSEGRKEKDEAVTQLRRETIEQVAVATKDAYERGLHEDGYEKWYNDGKRDGINTGRREGRIEARKTIETEKNQAFDDGRQKTGYRQSRAKQKNFVFWILDK